MFPSNFTVNPISAAWNTVARFNDYADAQRAVDRLSDDGFPVEKLDIIGSDLRLVERVTGRPAAAGRLLTADGRRRPAVTTPRTRWRTSPRSR